MRRMTVVSSLMGCRPLVRWCWRPLWRGMRHESSVEDHPGARPRTQDVASMAEGMVTHDFDFSLDGDGGSTVDS
jgi:hypothetical protein